MRTVIKTTLSGFQRLFKPGAPPADNALVLTGGGTRASYQAGVLQYIAEAFPEARFPILTGVSAGAINAAHLANHRGTFAESVGNLTAWWGQIRTEHVLEPSSSIGFLLKMVRRGGREELGEALPRHGLVDTAPLRAYLQEKLRTNNGHLSGITSNIEAGRLKAFAVVTINYGTGQTVSWMQGRNLRAWERPNRVGVQTTLTVEHIMASTSLPFLFPAVRLGESWHGDGGVRLAHPLAPAIYLGADRILAIATRYEPTRSEANVPSVYGYPPAAQIFGLLMDAVFLDTLEQDGLLLERINQLVTQLPVRKRMGLRPIRFLMIRPSVDIGKLAGEYEPHLTGALRLLARGLGSSDTSSPDWLSMLLFVPDYTRRLIEIGHRDAAQQHDKIAAFLSP
jgi:NTE family protein